MTWTVKEVPTVGYVERTANVEGMRLSARLYEVMDSNGSSVKITNLVFKSIVKR